MSKENSARRSSVRSALPLYPDHQESGSNVFEMAYAELTSGPFYFEDVGDGREVIFSHGFLMDHRMFRHQIGALRGSFRCISWDQRGHGETAYEGGSYSFWDSAADLLALLDHLEVGSAFFVGMSQGGFVHLRAALNEPKRIDGLVFVDSQAGLEDPEMVPAYDAMVEQWIREGPSDDVAEVVASILLGPGAPQDEWIATWKAREPTKLLEPYQTLMSRDDLTGRLGEISAPSLVIHGEEDTAISLDRAQALCNGLAACDGLVTVPTVGHAANLGAPEAVTEAIEAFLGKHA